MNSRSRSRPDPVTFFLVCTLVVTMGALLSSFLYGLLQLAALDSMEGRGGAILAKVQGILPIVMWLGTAASALLAFVGWHRVRLSAKGGLFLFIGLVGLLGFCLAGNLNMRSLVRSLHAAQGDSQDSRDAHQEQLSFINADIAQQREVLRGELTVSDQIRAQVTRMLAKLRLEDAAFPDLDALLAQFEKLYLSSTGTSLTAEQSVTIERELMRIFGSSDPTKRHELRSNMTHGSQIASNVRRMLDRLSLKEAGYSNSAVLMEDLQRLHNATADGTMSYPEMVTLEREFKRLYCEDQNGTPPRQRAIPTPLPTPKPGPEFSTLSPPEKPNVVRPRAPEPDLPGQGYSSDELGFATRFPKEWRITEDPAGNMVIASQPIRNPRNPVRNSIAILKLTVKGSPEALRDSYLESFEKDAEGFKELERGMIPMRAGRAAFVRCAFDEMGVRRQCIQIAIPGKENGGFLLSMTSNFDTFEALRREFMIASLFFELK